MLGSFSSSNVDTFRLIFLHNPSIQSHACMKPEVVIPKSIFCWKTFGFKPDVSQKPPQQSGSGVKRKHKKKDLATKVNSIWKKNTICLRFKEQCKGPNMEEKIILAKAGLGLKELIYNNDGDALHIHHVITEAFKELEKAGS